MSQNILLFALLSLISCSTLRLNESRNIKEIWIYDYFNDKGYTPGGVFATFEKFELEKTTMKKLNDTDKFSVLEMLLESQTSKLLPSKTGTHLLFAKFLFKDGTTSHVTIQSNQISDYTKNISYEISNSKSISWIIDFKKRIKDY